MEKKLYRVKIVLFVMAENQSAACVAATRARFEIFDCITRRADYVEPEWSEAVPYNADDDRACSQILADEQLAARPEAYFMNLPINVEAGLRVLDTGNGAIQLGQQSRSDR